MIYATSVQTDEITNLGTTLMRSANVFVLLVLATLVGLYFYGSPKYGSLKKECIEAGMDHSDSPSDDELHSLWMDCRRIGFGPPL